MHKKIIKNIIVGSIGFSAGLQLAQLVKLNFMVGSYAAFFSLTNCLLPLSGALLGMGGALLVTLAKVGMSIASKGTMLPFYSLAFWIPGLCASYYWASSSIMIRCLMPLACMLLFVLHPVGADAWIYAMYWWIPVILYITQRNDLFATALGSTFVAHGVGSVIWLYTVPMTAATWLALIPIVFIERLLFALGMIVLYRCGQYLMQLSPISWSARIKRTA